MSGLRLVLAWIRARPLMSVLSLLLVSLGVGTVVLVSLVSEQLEDRAQRDAAGIDLVVGARGSALQLVLAGVYHLDVPPGNIPWRVKDEIEALPMVGAVLPVALGDNFRGFRIVGSQAALVDWFGARLEQGERFDQPMQVVVGAQVARETGLTLGARFAGQHGLSADGPAHGDAIYTVRGVLAPTASVVDRLILTSVESIWQVHEGEPADDAERAQLEAEREITLLLLRYASPLAAVTVPRSINAAGRWLAASPSFESARLMGLLGVGVDTLRGLGVLILLMAGASVFVALLQALSERRRELALLRLLGARPRALVGLLMLEGLLLTAPGAILGALAAHLALALVGQVAVSGVGLPLQAWMLTATECGVVVGAMALGIVAALWPAWRVTRLPLADTLASS
jgi:putative ABC transport system permease protein